MGKKKGKQCGTALAVPLKPRSNHEPPAAKAAKPRQRTPERATPAFSLAAWLDHYDAVSAAIGRHGDLEALLDAGGGIAKVKHFLPRAAADGLLALLRRLPPGAWNNTSSARDYAHNDIAHAFESAKCAAAGGGGRAEADALLLRAAFRALSLLRPGELHTFSAARYCRGHHIEPHDDRAYINVLMDDGSVEECSRRIAAILYLTPDWKEEWGGHLVDMETGEVHVPEFNSLVAFRIPRWHAVTPVACDTPRYSIFGWFLEPGRLYPLQLGSGDDASGGSGEERGDAPAGRGGRGGGGGRAGEGQELRRAGKRKKKQPAPSVKQRRSSSSPPGAQPAGKAACKAAAPGAGKQAKCTAQGKPRQRAPLALRVCAAGSVTKASKAGGKRRKGRTDG